MTDFEFDDQPHRWSNYCLYCHGEPFEPAALHGLRLWHYCVRCVLICDKCHQEKPAYAFPYNRESAEFQRWKRAQDSGSIAISNWKKSYGPPGDGAVARASKEAHLTVCTHCDMRRLEREDMQTREKSEAERQAVIEKQKKMLQAPGAQAALDAILKGLS